MLSREKYEAALEAFRRYGFGRVEEADRLKGLSCDPRPYRYGTLTRHCTKREAVLLAAVLVELAAEYGAYVTLSFYEDDATFYLSVSRALTADETGMSAAEADAERIVQ